MAESPAAHVPVPPAHRAGRSAVVLLIDDSVATRYALRRHLERRGYGVWEAPTGEQGIDLARSVPDVVVLDVRLPDLDGFEVCRRLRTNPTTRSVPVIQYSTLATAAPERISGMEAGADVYLPDPEPDLVVATIASVLRQRAAEADVRLMASLGMAMDAAPTLAEGLAAVRALLVPARAGVCVIDVKRDPLRLVVGGEDLAELSDDAVALPLVARGERVGYLGMDRGPGGPFTAGDLPWMTALASRLSLAVDNGLLLERATREAARQRKIQEFSSALAAAVTRDEAAFAVALRGADATGAQFANIGLATADGSLRLFHGPQVEEVITDRWVVVGRDERVPLADAARTGTAVLVHDLHELAEQYPDLYDDAVAAGVESSASVPLVSTGGAVLGAMGFGWARPLHRPSTDRLATIDTLASIVSQALEREEVLERERRTRADLEALAGLLHETSRASTGGQILTACAQALAALPAALCGSAALVDPVSGRVVHSVHRPGGGDGPSAAPAAGPAAGAPDALATAWRERREVIDSVAGVRPPASGVVAAVPLVVDDTCLGALAAEVASEEAAGAVMALLRSFADVAAQALDRARRSDHDRRNVEVLQRSLLPRSLPTVDGVDLGGVYLPASSDRIGGDWYDVLPLGGSAVALVVGDVVGHGLASAALMGRIRHSLRALARGGRRSPAALLESVEETLVTDEGEMATVLYVALDPATGSATWASAGHPPPLVVRADGTASYLAGGLRPPLGVEASPGAPHVEAGSVTLGPGDTVILYTDGLVERRTESIEAGMQRLRELAAATPDLVMEDLEHSLVRRMLAPSVEDDVAVLVARLLPRRAAGR